MKYLAPTLISKQTLCISKMVRSHISRPALGLSLLLLYFILTHNNGKRPNHLRMLIKLL